MKWSPPVSNRSSVAGPRVVLRRNVRSSLPRRNVQFSTHGSGLATAIACAGLEATIVEMSWYGDRPVEVQLGGAFHSRRLRLVSSQVGQVSPGRRPRWNYGRRMAAALGLLDQPALDWLVAEEIAFADAPRELPRILGPSPGPSLEPGAHGLAPVIRYSSS